VVQWVRSWLASDTYVAVPDVVVVVVVVASAEHVRSYSSHAAACHVHT